MSRHRRGNGPFVAKARYLEAKAVDMGSTDSQLLIGTIADANAQQVPDTDLYWLLFKKHPWIRACVRIIANAVVQGGFSVSKIEGDDTQPLGGQEDPTETRIREFFRNAFFPRTFRGVEKATAVDLEIYGWAFWLKKYTGSLLTNLERLDPRMIEPKLNDAKTAIDRFELRKNRLSNTGTIVEQVSSTSIPANQVIMFTLDEGGDVVLGSPSPLEALDLTTAMDLNIRKHRNSFFKNGATTGNVLINKDATEESVRSAEKQLISMKVGVGNSYKNLILPGDWEVKSLMQSGKQELDFVKSTDIVRDEICAVYSVPVSKLMSVSGAMGQSGKGEDDETFEQECVLPLEELLYEKMTSEILQKEFGITDYELVPKRRNGLRFDRIQAAKDLVTCGGTGNEARAIIGLAPIDDDKYDMDAPLFVGHTAQTVSDDEPTKPQAPDQKQNIDDANDELDDQSEVGQKAAKGFRQDSIPVLKAKKDDHKAHHLAAIESATPKLAKGLESARRQYVAAFWAGSGLVRKASNDANALSAAEVATIQEAISTLSGTVYADVLWTEMDVLLEAGWDAAKRYLALEESFDTIPVWAITELQKATVEFGKIIDAREKQALKDTLAQALYDGATPSETASRIADTFAEGYHIYTDEGIPERIVPTDEWSQMVARTELSRAQNAGAMAFYREADVEKVEWVTTEGENVCPMCADADGSVVRLGEDFPSVDVDSPPAHPRCCPPGTMISTASGAIPIEDVKVGDSVRTHTGSLQRVTAVVSNEISEEIIKLRVGSLEVRLTGNHPVLTENGWTPAESLQPGDKVVCMAPQAVFGSTLKMDNVPSATAEESFLGSILGTLPIGLMPVPSVYLDGQLSSRDGQIYPVNANCEISHEVYAGVVEGHVNDGFVSRFDSALPVKRSGDLDSLAVFTSPNGRMGRSRDTLTVFGGCAPVANQLGFGQATPLESKGLPVAVDRPAVYAKFAREIKDRFSKLVSRMKLSRLGFSQPPYLSAHAFIVPLSSAVREYYHGLVHNFSVAVDESYVADGVVVHNCACAVVAADKDIVDASGGSR